MGKETGIAWTHHTFNMWRGCTKVSPGCQHCYAETLSKRNPKVLGEWGPKGTRVIASESMWRQPLAWDRAAKEAGERRRVFCASLADVMENWTGPVEDARGVQVWKRSGGTWTTSDHYSDTVPLAMGDVRQRLGRLILDTPHLDWLLLTKRPENWQEAARDMWCRFTDIDPLPVNVWLGVSVEDQQRAEERIPLLLRIEGVAVRFLSVEPLLGPVNLMRVADPPASNIVFDSLQGYWHGNEHRRIDWVIVGGESGSQARPCDVAWVRRIVEQCEAADVPCFVKQLGANIKGLTKSGIDHDKIAAVLGSTYRFLDPKGGDMAEWPEDLRVRELPRRASRR